MVSNSYRFVGGICNWLHNYLCFWVNAISTVNLPAASRGASLTQLEFKLRRPLLEVSMVLNILLNHFTSHAVPNRPHKIPVLPQLSRPQTSLQRRELAEQSPCTVAFYNSNHFSNGSLRRKRQQNMNMFHCHLHLHNFKSILLSNFTDQLLRSFPYFLTVKYFLPILRTPHQMVTRIVNRMTRSSDRHACLISHFPARAYQDKGDAIRSPLNPLVEERIHPRGKPRGILLRIC
jgi:hypothetical protein